MAISGVVLLCLWVVTLVGVFSNRGDKSVSKWHNRMEPFHMKESAYAKNNDMMLALATTLMPTDVAGFGFTSLCRTSTARLPSCRGTRSTFCRPCRESSVLCMWTTSIGSTSATSST